MSIHNWSPTAADNDTIDAAINWSEFQNPDTVNNSARAMMGRLAEFLDDLATTEVTGGTGNAYTITNNSGPVALTSGEIVGFCVDRANTG